MKRSYLFFCISCLLLAGFSAGTVLADDENHVEAEDHICFRSMDMDANDIVIWPEFKLYYGDRRDLYDSVDSDQSGDLSHDEYHDALGHGALQRAADQNADEQSAAGQKADGQPDS